MTTNNDNSGQLAELYRTVAVNFLIPVVFVAITGLIGWISRIEERQYAFQREAVTKQEQATSENRVMSYMDVRIKDLDNKLTLIVRQLEILGTRIQKD